MIVNVDAMEKRALLPLCRFVIVGEMDKHSCGQPPADETAKLITIQRRYGDYKVLNSLQKWFFFRLAKVEFKKRTNNNKNTIERSSIL